MDDPNSQSSCVLEFDSDDPLFVRGVEVGMMWAALRNSVEPERIQIRAANAEMAMRIAEALRRPYRGEDVDDDWMLMEFDSPGEI